MKKLLIATSILAATGYAQADYQFEAGAAYGQADAMNVDVDTGVIAGEFYLESVDTGKGPLAEAAFLDQASGIMVMYSSTEFDVPGADEIDSFGIGGRLVTSNKLILELDYSETDGGNFNSDSDTVRLGIGTYLNDRTDIVASYETESTDGADDVDILNIALHSVCAHQGGASLAYDLSASYIDAEDDSGHNLSAGATYYVNNALGFNLSVDATDIGDFDSTNASIGVNYFPMENLQIEASWFDQGGDSETDGFLIGAALRF